jgi:O-antigen/teichoic acid export membrane protein
LAASHLAVNSRRNVAAFIVAIAAQFLVVPLVISDIGLTAFGHAGLVLAVWAPLALIGTVIGQAATREISAALAAGRVAGALQSSAIALCATGGVVAALVFVAVGPSVLAWLDSSGVSEADWSTLVLASVPGWFCQQLVVVMQGVASARQDFRLVAKMSIATAVSGVICTLGAVYLRPDAVGYLSGVSAGFVLTSIVSGFMVRDPGAPAPSARGSLADAARSLLGFSRWQSVYQATGTIGNQVDRYLLASLASPAVIGQFNAANRLQEAAYMLVMKAAEVLFPRFGARSLEEPQERLRFFLIASWAVTSLSGVVLAPLIILAEPLMRLWAGAETAAGGAVLLQVLTVGGLIGCGTTVFTYYMMGMGETRPLAAISALYSVLTVIFSALAMLALGPMVAGAGLALASVVRVMVSMIWTRFRTFPTSSWSDLLNCTVVPLAASLAVCVFSAGHIAGSGIDSWWELAVAGVIVVPSVAVSVLAASALSGFGRSAVSAVMGGLVVSMRGRV